jgi:hypothetical protein
MRWPNFLTSGLEARSVANFPSSTSAIPPWAAFFTKVLSAALRPEDPEAELAPMLEFPFPAVCAAAPSPHKLKIPRPNDNLLRTVLIFISNLLMRMEKSSKVHAPDRNARAVKPDLPLFA